MNNKTILQIIKKDLEELRILVDDLEVNEHPEQLLIDITRAKAQTLLQEFSLLKSNEPVTEAVLPKPQEIPVVILVEDAPISEEEPIVEPAIEMIQEIVVVQVEEEPAEEELVEEGLVEEVVNNKIPEERIEEQEAVELEEEIVLIEEEIIVEVPVEEQVQPEEVMPEPISEIVEAVEEIQLEEVPVDELIIIEEPQEILPEVVEIEEVKESNLSVADHTNNLLSADDFESNEKKVFGEQFSKEPSLNDRLGSTKNNESKFRGLPISNMKSAIGLNDRFLFTRELFGNINAKFEATIEAIDNANNIIEAIEYLEQNYKWKKNETSLKFMELVKRRFEK